MAMNADIDLDEYCRLVHHIRKAEKEAFKELYTRFLEAQEWHNNLNHDGHGPSGEQFGLIPEEEENLKRQVEREFFRTI
jgi:hypothetical protein